MARIRPLPVSDRAAYLDMTVFALASAGHWPEQIAAEQAAARDSPSDPRDELRELPTAPPTAGSAAEGADRSENRRASGTNAGRAASTARSATQGHSNRRRAAPGVRIRWVYRAHVQRPAGDARARLRHSTDCPPDRR